MTEVPATNATTLNYADLVREGKRAVAAIDAAWWGLAELADKIDTVYREHTLEDFGATQAQPVRWSAA